MRSSGYVIAVIGCGKMGTAILSGIISAYLEIRASGIEPPLRQFYAVVRTETSATRLAQKFNHLPSGLLTIRWDDNANIEAIKLANVIFLACKPYMASKILNQDGMKEALAGKLVISVLVGMPIQQLRRVINYDHGELGEPYLKRAMPNLAAEYAQSITVIEETTVARGEVEEDFEEITQWIFQQCGKTCTVTEDTFDIAGVLAGASPALLSVAIDGMLDGAVMAGMKRAQAREILLQSLVGTARVLAENEGLGSGEALRERITSPRGTTIAGLLALEEGGARWKFANAVGRATKRSFDIASDNN